MRRGLATLAIAALVASTSMAAEPPKSSASKPPETKEMSGISILGNQDAPKSLVIVPWKSSEIGAGIDLANSMNGRATPLDKDVFARQLHYYEIRSGAKGR
jgi:Rieske Fe-S protein